MIPCATLLYLYIRASLSLHLRGFFLQQMAISTETHCHHAENERNKSLQHSALNGDIYTIPISSETQELWERLIQRWWMTSRKQCFLHMTGQLYIWTEPVTAHKRPVQTQARQNPSGRWTERERGGSRGRKLAYWVCAMSSKEVETPSCLSSCLVADMSYKYLVYHVPRYYRPKQQGWLTMDWYLWSQEPK